MPTAIATVRTDAGSRYLQQLCKHFAHKLPARFDPQHGRIEFPAGLCTLAAAPDGLTLTVETPDADSLARLTDVVARHLQRFAFREEPAVAWTHR